MRVRLPVIVIERQLEPTEWTPFLVSFYMIRGSLMKMPAGQIGELIIGELPYRKALSVRKFRSVST